MSQKEVAAVADRPSKVGKLLGTALAAIAKEPKP